MALKDWKYVGYGLYEYKPTGVATKINDILELKYYDWFEATRLDAFLPIIKKTYDFDGAHDLKYVKKIKGENSPDVALGLFKDLFELRTKKLAAYKVLVSDPDNPKLKKNLQKILEDENDFLKDSILKIEVLIDSQIEDKKQSRLKRFAEKRSNKDLKINNEVVSSGEQILDFQLMQQILSKQHNQNYEMADEFDIFVSGKLRTEEDANIKQINAKREFVKQLVKEVPTAKDDAYTKRLLQEDAKMFKKFDMASKKDPHPRHYPSGLFMDRTHEDDVINSNM